MAVTARVCKHNQTITDHESGEVICTSCGVIVGNDMEVSFSALTAYEDELENKHIHTSPRSTLVRNDNGLGTVIDSADTYGNRIATAEISRMRLWNERVRHNTNRYLVNNGVLLKNIASKLGIPDYVKEKAAYLFRKASKIGLSRGVSGDSLMTACIYLAMRENNLPVTIKELVSTAGKGSKMKEVSRIYKRIVFVMDIKIPQSNPMMYVPAIVSKLGIGENVARSIRRNIAIAMANKYTAGKNPVCIAAAVTWLTTKLYDMHVTQYRIAMTAGVTSMSIRNMAREIMKLKGIFK